jgi:hypothetical protein
MARPSQSSTFMFIPVESLDVRARGASFMQPIMFQPKVKLALDVIVAELLEADGDVIEVAVRRS